MKAGIARVLIYLGIIPLVVFVISPDAFMYIVSGQAFSQVEQPGREQAAAHAEQRELGAQASANDQPDRDATTADQLRMSRMMLDRKRAAGLDEVPCARSDGLLDAADRVLVRLRCTRRGEVLSGADGRPWIHAASISGWSHQTALLHAARPGVDPQTASSAMFSRVQVRVLDRDAALSGIAHWLREFGRLDDGATAGDGPDLMAAVRSATPRRGIDALAVSGDGLEQRIVFFEMSSDTDAETAVIGYLCRPVCEYESPIVVVPLSAAPQ